MTRPILTIEAFHNSFFWAAKWSKKVNKIELIVTIEVATSYRTGLGTMTAPIAVENYRRQPVLFTLCSSIARQLYKVVFNMCLRP